MNAYWDWQRKLNITRKCAGLKKLRILDQKLSFLEAFCSTMNCVPSIEKSSFEVSLEKKMRFAMSMIESWEKKNQILQKNIFCANLLRFSYKTLQNSNFLLFLKSNQGFDSTTFFLVFYCDVSSRTMEFDEKCIRVKPLSLTKLFMFQFCDGHVSKDILYHLLSN